MIRLGDLRRPACGTSPTNGGADTSERRCGFGGIVLLAACVVAALWLIATALSLAPADSALMSPAVHVIRPASCPACPATILAPRDVPVTYTVRRAGGHGGEAVR